MTTVDNGDRRMSRLQPVDNWNQRACRRHAFVSGRCFLCGTADEHRHILNAKIKLGTRTLPHAVYEYVMRYRSEP